MKRTIPLLLPLALAVLAGCQDRNLPTGSPDGGAIAFSQGQSKTAVCHYDAVANTYHKITIADPGLPAHIAHGDAMPGEALPGNSGTLNDSCVSMTIVLDLGNSYSTALFGGTGGGSDTNSCPSGSVAVGIDGFYGVYEYSNSDQIGTVRLLCAVLRGDGTLGAPSQTDNLGNGTAFFNQIPFSGSCTSGQMLVAGSGDHIEGAQYVSQIGGACGSLSRILSAAGGSDTSIGPWGTAYGNAFTAACNPGSLITGITGLGGFLVDAVGFICTPVLQQTL